MALLQQHVPEVLTQAADLDGISCALEILLDLPSQPVCRLHLLCHLAQLDDHVGNLTGQGRVLLRELRDQGMLALGLPLARLRVGPGLFRFRLTLAVDELLQNVDPLADPHNADGGLLSFGLQQIHPHRLAQQFLVQRLDLATQHLATGLEHPSPGLRQGRTLVGGRSQLYLGGNLLLLPLRLGETLPDQHRAIRLFAQALLEIRAFGVGSGKIGLLLLQGLLDPWQRGRRLHFQGICRIRNARFIHLFAERLDLSRRRLRSSLERHRCVRVGGCQLQVTEGLAVELHQLGLGLLLDLAGGLDLGDLGFQNLRGHQRRRSGAQALFLRRCGRTQHRQQPETKGIPRPKDDRFHKWILMHIGTHYPASGAASCRWSWAAVPGPTVVDLVIEAVDEAAESARIQEFRQQTLRGRRALGRAPERGCRCRVVPCRV